MGLQSGTAVGLYTVVASIGVGGMGEVYRAHDAKLGRDVALKMLPDVFAGDADRLARFEREARTLASLNHPNIAHIYDAGRDRAGAYLVMELVEGEDLAALIARGPMPPADVLPIARQIADALEAAHEAGVIHRDLKPANVKLRPDGTVKVLDFGLAKALSPEGAGATTGDAANSPTLTARATEMGMILGTAAYMAPEQARGRAVDRRADIWAFGVVLYEMLAGRRAFDGDDMSITLASVLKDEVDWRALPSDLPEPWRRVLRRCLEKDPRRRLSAIGDARLELEEPARSEPGTVALVVPVGRAGSRVPWLVASASAVGLVAALAAGWWAQPVESPAERVAFTWTVSNNPANIYPAVSPDGRQFAYVAPREAGSPNVIWVRPVGTLEAQPLAGTDGAVALTWSPDSRSMAFSAGGRVLRVSTAGGGVERLGQVVHGAGLTWLPDGDVLAVSNPEGPCTLWRLRAGGGEPVELPRPAADGPAASCTYPVMLPGGERFLYLGWSANAAERALFIGSLDGRPPVRLLASDAHGAWADGHVFFVRERTLYAQAFDHASLQLSGEPVRLADDVLVNTLAARAAYAVGGGVLAYRQGALVAHADLAWFDRAGRALGTAGDGGNIFQFRLSPDGRRVAVADAPVGGVRLSILDLGNGVSSRLTDEVSLPNDPVWSPDSQTVAYEAVKDGIRQVFTHQVGSSTPVLAFESPDNPKWLDDWSRDGQYLLFHRPRPSQLYAVKPGDPSSVRLLLDTPESVDGAHFSPDGRWIAYQVTESGVYNVWVASFPAFDQRRQVSRQGGGQAMWRGDGRELFYLTPQGMLMSVAVTLRPSGGMGFAAPVELFQTPLTSPNLTIDQYSVTADGQRFLILRPRATTAADQLIHVVVNWAAR